MSVADILERMAENAGRSRLQRGAILGDVVAEAAKVPAGILADQERARLEQQQQARLQAQDARGVAQDARQAAADTRDQALQAETLKKQAALKAGIAAGFGASTDPKQFDLGKAAKTVTDAGYPELVTTISDVHDKLQPKITRGAPGSVSVGPDGLPIPGSAIPEKKADYTVNGQRFSGDGTPIGEPVPTQAAPKGYQHVDKLLDGKPATLLVDPAPGGKVYDLSGAPIENASTRVKPIPPASVQIQNLPPPPAQPPSKAEIAMAHYMVPTPSPRSFATPAGKAMMDRILTENPDFDASLYSVRAPTRKAFTTGTQGQQLTAMNTAVEHLDQLQRAADALDNGNLVPGNALWQSLKETFGSNAPTNYDTIKNMVDKEVEAVANKGVPTVSGTAEQKALAGKKAAPGQIQGYINTLIPLMGSKVNALHFQYKQAMGANDPFDPLTPEAKAILAKRGFDPSAAASTPAAAPKDGDTKPIDGFPGTEQTFKNGKWIRTK